MGMKPRKRIKVTGNVAVLSGLVGGLHNVKDIAKGTKMTASAVSSSLSQLQKKGWALRTNKKAFGVAGKYKITSEGRAVLRAAKKAL